MLVPEINEVKTVLTDLKNIGFIQEWELPYENLLTRRSAAIFFLTPTKPDNLEDVNNRLVLFEHYAIQLNTERTLSKLKYQVTFNKEVKDTLNAATEKAALV